MTFPKKTSKVFVWSGWYLSLSNVGNEIVHVLTKKNHSSLHIIINSTSGDTWFEDYHIFAVGDESNRYRLTLGGPANGTAGR